jgi:hypothetical protein
VGEAGTATEAAEQGHSLELPASPVLRPSGSWGVGVTDSDVQCSTDAIGIALNGVTIFTAAVGGDDCSGDPPFVDVDDMESEWNSFDCCSGHTRSFEGATYHYHFPPSCLLAQIGDLSDGHSPQIGWAFDGFPIYGPKGPGGVDMTYGGSYGSCTGDYCLDECGGVEAELTDVDSFSYRYYVVGAASDLSTLPGDPKPSAAASAVFSTSRVSFTLNCYRGYVYTDLTGGSTGTSGVTSSYTATAMAGVTTKYEPEGLCGGAGFTTIEAAHNGLCSTAATSSCNSAWVGITDATPAPTAEGDGGSASSTPHAHAGVAVCAVACAMLLVSSV